MGVFDNNCFFGYTSFIDNYESIIHHPVKIFSNHVLIIVTKNESCASLTGLGNEIDQEDVEN